MAPHAGGVDRARGVAGPVERFVQYVVGGGLLLVAGLWVAALAPAWSPPWLVGAALSLVGAAGLGLGIRRALSP